MKLKKVIKAAHNQINGGSEYGWDCYGPDARWMDFSNVDGTEIGSCVYDTKTQRVYEVESYNDNYDTHYTWRDAEYVTQYEDTAMSKGVDPYIAYDDKKTNIVDQLSILSILESYAMMNNEKRIGPDNWPFPEVTKTVNDEWDNASVTIEDDTSYLDEVGETDVTEEEIEKAFPGATMKNEYEVIITSKHRFTVKARTMEEAADRAANWVQGIKGYDWPEDTCWEEHYVTKKQVGITNED